MPEPDKGVSWLSITEKIDLPLAIAMVGIWFNVTTSQQQEFERNLSYVKMLISENPKERFMGLTIVESLQQKNKLDPVLIVVVKQLAGGSEGSPQTALAQSIVASATTATPDKPKSSFRNINVSFLC